MVRVAVFVPCYNAGPFLDDCLRSVQTQSFADWELTVVDNQSTDGSFAIAQRYAASDARIRVLRNDTNVGMVGNWNRCLKLGAATATYMKVLCADDELPVDSLAVQVAALEAAPTAVLASGHTRLVNRTGRILITRRSPFVANRAYAAGEVRALALQKGGNIVGEPSVVMFRTAPVTETGLRFDAAYAYAPDLAFWMSLLKSGSLVACNAVVAHYRIHESALTKTLQVRGRAETSSIYSEWLAGASALQRARFHAGVIARGWIRSLVIRLANSRYAWLISKLACENP